MVQESIIWIILSIANYDTWNPLKQLDQEFICWKEKCKNCFARKFTGIQEATNLYQLLDCFFTLSTGFNRINCCPLNDAMFFHSQRKEAKVQVVKDENVEDIFAWIKWDTLKSIYLRKDENFRQLMELGHDLASNLLPLSLDYHRRS